MNAPSRLSPLQLDETITQHIGTNYVIQDGEYHCRNCGMLINYAVGNISVHDEQSQVCAGAGRVLNVPLPYCPRCEGLPSEVRGCVHIGAFANGARRNLLLAILILAGCVAIILGMGILL